MSRRLLKTCLRRLLLSEGGVFEVGDCCQFEIENTITEGPVARVLKKQNTWRHVFRPTTRIGPWRPAGLRSAVACTILSTLSQAFGKTSGGVSERSLKSAAAMPHELSPEGETAFAFQRTVSRLMEMQADDYIAAEHIN